VVTACCLIDRSRWGAHDPFDATFFFNYEDHDFGLRTRILGHEILSVPSAHCYHREGTPGLSLRDGGQYAKMRVFCLIRNRWQLILKNYAWRTIFFLFPIFFVYEVFQLAGILKKGWLCEWGNAVCWIAFHPGAILRKRQVIQHARKTPDRDILRNGPLPFRQGDLLKSAGERWGKALLDRFATMYWNIIQRLI
jgi:hypothetical protein